MVIEGWSAWDAFYMTVITVTTVGYKEVHDLSRAGQVFTVVLLFGGVGAALYTFTLLATVVVEGGLPKRLQRDGRHTCSTPSRTTSSSAATAGSAASSPSSSSARTCRSSSSSATRADAGGARAMARWRSKADASHEDVLKRVGIERARG